MSWREQPEHEVDLSRALSGEDCDTKDCSERQAQLQAGAEPPFPQTPSWHGVELTAGDNLTVNSDFVIVTAGLHTKKSGLKTNRGGGNVQSDF
jgi:hypothetical protein